MGFPFENRDMSRVKDIFSPIFLATLITLGLVHKFGPYPGLFPPIIALMFTLTLVFYYLKKFQAAYWSITLAIALLIGSAFLVQGEAFEQKSSIPVPQDEYITIEGRLKEYPEIGEGESTLVLESRVLEYHREKHNISLNLRITVKGRLDRFFKGDTITLNASLSAPRLTRNFFPNTFENYQSVRKIHFQGFSKSAHWVGLKSKGPWFWRIIGQWRNRIRQVIERKYRARNGPLDARGVFLEAILIGDRGRVSTDTKNQMIDAGVYHLLAISGAHIGIMAIFLLFLARSLNIPFRIRIIVTALCLILFLFLSGLTIPAQRAVFMAVLIFIGRILYLDIHIFNIISFTGILILVGNPAEFLDPGFILTFTLTAAIVLGREMLMPYWARLKKVPTAIKELLAANFSASLIALPLSLFYFKMVSLAGFLSGLLLVPLTALIIYIGLLLIMVAPVSSGLCTLLVVPAHVLLTLFLALTRFFSATLSLTIFKPSPSIFLVILILVSFYAAIRLKNRKYYRIAVPLAWLIFILGNTLALVDFSPYKPGRLEVFFLDVGQGDCELAVFPDGRALLIDGGGSSFSDFEVGRQVVLPFILQQGIRVHWVAVSHFHPDHVRGICEIIPILKPREVWLSSTAVKDPFYHRFKQALERTKKTRIIPVDASFQKMVAGCRIECLQPQEFIYSDYSLNNHSQVLKVSDAYHAFLFAGDIEKEVEDRLIEIECKRLPATVIKVPHHGSRTSSSDVFLTCVKPQWAVFSYASGNRFQFPHPQVTANYKNRGTLSFSTARRGGIKIISLPGRVKIETSY